MKKALIALAAVAVILTACGSSTDAPTTPAPVENVGGSTESGSFVDTYEALHPGTITEFCGYVADLGVDASRDAFVQGFMSEYPDYDQAIDTFNELVSRC
jgi:hypothetical protein